MSNWNIWNATSPKNSTLVFYEIDLLFLQVAISPLVFFLIVRFSVGRPRCRRSSSASSYSPQSLTLQSI